MYSNNASFVLLDISEIGKTSRCFSEIAQRSDPTVSDVQLALIDLGGCDTIKNIVISYIGSKVTKLDDYSRRPQRRHLPRRMSFIYCNYVM